MNEQTIDAFNAFHIALSDAIDTLHTDLQSTNSLTGSPMYADQFDEIVAFHTKTKAFTQFLKDQSDYHRFQYSQFKESQKEHKVPQRSTSSQISIQSTPQSLNEWSYNANDGESAPNIPIWRGYDPQPAYDLFNGTADIEIIKGIHISDIDIEIIKNDPFKVIDTDNDSECTVNIPSLPPSVSISPPSISTAADNEEDQHVDDSKEVELYLYEEDIANGGEDHEDDEKWDIPLIKTIAFAGYFESDQLSQVEFKNDNVVKPKPPKWQEREEENKQIIHALSECDVNDINDIAIIEAAVEHESTPNINTEEEMKEEEEAASKRCKTMISSCSVMKSRQSEHNLLNTCIEEKDRDQEDARPALLSTDIRFNTARAPPHIAFIEYARPKANVYGTIKDHPHYHPLIHGEEGTIEEGNDEEERETAMNDGERDAVNNVHHRSQWNDDTSSHLVPEHEADEIGGFINRDIHIMNDSINGLRNVLDHHFNRNHDDFIEIKEALYSLKRPHARVRCNYNNNNDMNNYNDTKMRKRNNSNKKQERWRSKKKEKWNM